MFGTILQHTTLLSVKHLTIPGCNIHKSKYDGKCILEQLYMVIFLHTSTAEDFLPHMLLEFSVIVNTSFFKVITEFSINTNEINLTFIQTLS